MNGLAGFFFLDKNRFCLLSEWHRQMIWSESDNSATMGKNNKLQAESWFGWRSQLNGPACLYVLCPGITTAL